MRGLARPGLTFAALAAAGTLALAACGSSGTTSTGGAQTTQQLQGEFGKLPAQITTGKSGGTATFAEPPGATPTWILPIITAAANSVYTVTSFDYLMWRPLYWAVNGVKPEIVPSMSLAKAPVWSNGDKTVTITMNSAYKWSDGTALTSKDLLFDIDEIKAGIKANPANWAYYTPGFFPDDVASMTTPNSSTLVMTLTKAVNPTWFEEDQLSSLQPMPAHAWAKASASGPTLDFTVPANAKKIYAFLATESKSLGTYATNPLWQVVDGPFHLTAFNSTTGANTMKVNPAYGGPHTAKEISTFQAVPFTSDTAEFNAVKAGSIDAGYVPQNDVPQIPSVKANGYNVFGYPDFGWSYVAYNFKDKTGDFNNIIGQQYIRAALAHLEDEQGYINAFMHGAGGQAYGPVPAAPASPFTPSNALTNPYPFSVSAATSLLTSHGWKVVPGGTDTCAKPGTGAGECGAGIPAGTKLAFPLVYSTNPVLIGQMVTDLASQAAKAGITITLKSSNFNFMVQNYNDPAAPANDSKWAAEDFGGFTNSTYPTTFGVFNSQGGDNLGGYADPQADKLIQASISGSDISAVKAESAYLTTAQPGLFQPNPDLVMVWKTTISGPASGFSNMTQYYATPEFWHFTK